MRCDGASGEKRFRSGVGRKKVAVLSEHFYFFGDNLLLGPNEGCKKSG